jgi:hypothetical protein
MKELKGLTTMELLEEIAINQKVMMVLKHRQISENGN